MENDDQHLGQADRHIAAAERRITEQEVRLRRMEAAGEDISEAQRLLDSLRATLAEMHVHRRIIIDELAKK